MRVLIVDDHILFAEAIRGALEDFGVSSVEVVGSGADALSAVRRSMPDIILMDLGLPDQSGLVVGRAILEEWPDARILALTALNDRSAVDESLAIGFRGYLTKDTPVAQFVNAIRSVLDGQSVVPHRLASYGRQAPGDDFASLAASQLTGREREVLGLIAQGADSRSIAAELGISRNTVRTHVQSIHTKLQVHTRLEAATFAVRHRLVEVPSFPDRSEVRIALP